MNKPHPAEIYILGILTGVVASVIISVNIYCYRESLWEKTAINRGFAEFKIVDLETGKTEFKWKDNK